MMDTQQLGGVVAEPGQSTSEWQVLLGSSTGVVAALLGVATSFGVHLSDVQITSIEHLTETLAGLAAAYILGRSIRKAGTSG